MARVTQENRIPLSLRLPSSELDIINSYAANQRVSKTDAFLHYLRKGIEVEREVNPQLTEVLAKLDTVLKLVEQAPATLSVEDITDAVADLAIEYPAIQKVYLFGSFARGQATASSDVDLRMELADDGLFSLFDLSRFKKELERIIGRETDIITVESIGDQQLAKAFEKEKVLIYERKE